MLFTMDLACGFWVFHYVYPCDNSGATGAVSIVTYYCAQRLMAEVLLPNPRRLFWKSLVSLTVPVAVSMVSNK
jgi:hypothetical protein